jgi:hypothetical protein
MLVKQTGGKDFDPIPAGLHPAILYSLVDIGSHEGEWQGVKNVRHLVVVTFELPGQLNNVDSQEKPMAISGTYTLSLHKKAKLRMQLESWRSRPFTERELIDGFELKDTLGKNCQLNIVHNTKDGKTYANIGTIVPLGAGMEKQEPFNEIVYFAMDEGQSIPEKAPAWIKKKIGESLEWNEGQGQGNDWPDDHGSEEPPIHGYEEEPSQLSDDRVPF